MARCGRARHHHECGDASPAADNRPRDRAGEATLQLVVRSLSIMSRRLHRICPTLLLTVILSIASGALRPALAAGAPHFCDWSAPWMSAGNLSAKRYDQTATTLNDGRVLIVGGIDGGNTIGVAEIYNPSTGAITTTGSLITARTDHVATLLADGRVLVAGGRRVVNGVFNGRLSSAEIYNPATGQFTATTPMGIERQGATSVLLANGKVLVSGGFGVSPAGIGAYLQTAEIYDPAIGAFAATGAMATGRSSHTLTRLTSGRVLVAGGFSGSAYLASAEVFDPASGAFSATGALLQPRVAHTATMLPNGNVAVIGGNNDAYLSSVEIYNPTTGAFGAFGSLTTARASHTAVLLPSGKVLVAGGQNLSGELASVEVRALDGGIVALPALSV